MNIQMGKPIYSVYYVFPDKQYVECYSQNDSFTIVVDCTEGIFKHDEYNYIQTTYSKYADKTQLYYSPLYFI